MIQRMMLLGFAPLLILSACAKPPPPAAPPPPRDFTKPDPDKLLADLTTPYSSYRWVETVLVYELADLEVGQIPKPEQLAAAASKIDARLAQFRVMRRVVVHERWVAVGLGGVTHLKLADIRRYLNSRGALSLSLVKDGSERVRKMAAGVDPATGVKVLNQGGELFFFSMVLKSLRQAIDGVPLDLRPSPERWLVISPFSQSNQTNSGFRTYLLESPVWVDASDLQAVEMVKGWVDEKNEDVNPRLVLKFSPGAALRLRRLSKENSGAKVAVVVDDKVHSLHAAGEVGRKGQLTLIISEPVDPLGQAERATRMAKRLRKVAGLTRVNLQGVYGIQPVGR